MSKAVWTRNHWSNRIRDHDRPTGTIELEPLWRVTHKVGDNPPERREFDTEELAQMHVEYVQAKLGGTWERVGQH